MSKVKDKLPQGMSKRLETLFEAIEYGCQDVFGDAEKEKAARKKCTDARQEIRSLLIQAHTRLDLYENKDAWPEDLKLAEKIIAAIGEEKVQLSTTVGILDPKDTGTFTVQVVGSQPFWPGTDPDTKTNTVDVGRLTAYNLASIRSNLMLSRLMRCSTKPV